MHEAEQRELMLSEREALMSHDFGKAAVVTLGDGTAS
jgi:hypothetical protein